MPPRPSSRLTTYLPMCLSAMLGGGVTPGFGSVGMSRMVAASWPGKPTPMGAAPGGSASNKNLYTILAWALFPPIGSLIFLFVGKDDPDVKNNAAQATVIHGAALVIYIILWVLATVTAGILFFLP